MRVALRVQPRSSRNAVVGVRGERVKVCVCSAPVGGAANDAVIAVLAAWLGVKKKDVEIARGHSARDKTVHIAGATEAQLRERLGRLPSNA